MGLSGTLDTIGQKDVWTFRDQKLRNPHISNVLIDVLLVAVPFDSTATPGASSYLSFGYLLLESILKDAGYNVKILTGPNDPDYEFKL
jgi:hypothetical protein